MEQILHAAAEVFARRGFDGATTNAIAAQAGVSPGSLYQFFSNKQEVAATLAEHYAHRLAELRDEVFVGSPGADLEGQVRAVLDPLLAFSADHSGFKALFARTDMPSELREAVAPVQATIHGRVAELVADAVPGRSAEEVGRVATVTIQIVRGMIPLIHEADGQERDLLAAELRSVLVAYLGRRTAGPGVD